MTYDMRRPVRAEDLTRIDSEAGILATLVFHLDYSFHSEFLEPEHFSDEQNRILYRALKGMAGSGIKTVDTYGIQQYIKQFDPDNAEAIQKEAIDTFLSFASNIARHSLKEYKILVSNVWDVSFRREMFKKLKECEAILADSDNENVRKQVYEAVDSVMTSYSYGEEMEMFPEKIDELLNEIISRQGFGYAGIPFKFPSLNEYVTIERGELIIFAAQQKVGKSIMLLNCAVDLLKKGYSVLYIDSELSDRLFAGRMLAHVSGIEYRNLTSGNYTEEEKEKVFEARDWIKKQKFNHIYLPFFSSDAIYTAVKQMNHKIPVDVLIVDYFKSTGTEVGAFETYASMGKCVDVIKNEIAGAMNIAAIGAAQATKYGQLADSAKIARNASTIVMLIDKTKDEIAADGEECGNKKMVVSVNRNGMQHAEGEYIDLAFDGNHILYEECKQHTPISPY